MLKFNNEIRKAVSESNLKLWQIAERCGINDGNFSRRLRKELSVDEKVEIFKIIEELKMEG